MRVKAGLARGIADLVRHAPRWSTEPLSILLGGLLMATHERRATLDNLSRVWPEWPAIRRYRIAFAAYRQTARGLVEFLHYRDYDDAEFKARVLLEDEAVLAAAYAEGRGVIVLSGHFGNWEWIGRRIAAAGYPFAVLQKEPKDPGLAARLREIRTAAGYRLIDHDDMRAALKWIRQGGVLAIIMDQEPRKSRDGVVAPLFGQPTMTHVGPFRLARRTRAPVLTAFSRRTGRGRYAARLEPFPLSAAADADRAEAEEAVAFNARLEAAVRRDPDHWMWMYDRWKRLSRRQAATV